VFEAPLRRYTALTLLGSAIWAFGFAPVGYALGANRQTFHHSFRYVEYAIALTLVLGAAWLVVRKRRHAALGDRATDP